MARRAAKQKPLSNPTTLVCHHCNERKPVKEFLASYNKFNKTYMKIPYCKDCIDDIYMEYYDMYEKLGYIEADRKAIERICMAVDMYYSDTAFDAAMKKYEKNPSASLFTAYAGLMGLNQYSGKSYDTTLLEKYNLAKDKKSSVAIYTEKDEVVDKHVNEAVKIFGIGFEKSEYLYLYDQYVDWTSRHECNTKAQEEIFKQICYTQLELHNATIAKKDTKNLTDTLTKLMDAAKLQPKQNSGDTVADNQTFGTLIDKWENTRPLPETEDDLKDVDNIGLYIDVFFRGHLSKMMGLKNGLSNTYERFMKKYTVDKPEYDEEESSEALFDAVFGSSMSNDDD